MSSSSKIRTFFLPFEKHNVYCGLNIRNKRIHLIVQLKSQQDLSKFFNQHYRTAVIHATRIVKEQSIGEDLVQDCFIKFWEKRKEIDTPSLKNYFFKMVKNKSLDYLRVKRPITTEPAESDFHSEDHSKMEYEELSESINNIIDSLPERCRQVFVLSRFEEMTYKEIAKTLEISTKTVEHQVSKALRILGAGVKRFSLLFWL